MFLAEAVNLSKSFGTKQVLKNVNLQLEPGKIYGLLGKNGAGKTTLIKLFLGLLHPTEGEVFLFGNKPEGFNRKVGYLPENLAGYPFLSGFDNVDVVSRIMGCKLSKKEILDILERLNLLEAQKKKLKNYSLGMRRRIQLAFAILIGKEERELFFLDEPFNGLDVEGAQWLKKEFQALRSEGKTVIFSSHSIEEMEKIIDEYIIIHNGEIKVTGKVSELKKQVEKIAVTFETSQNVFIEEKLNELGIRFEKNSNEYLFGNNDEVLKMLVQNGLYPYEVKRKHKTLEELFSDVTRD